ncbi:DUF6882 domain-containing protein [Williamsia sp. CHRR-6]|uniref:DUF6882 domain-containing protein n=1 Tax=Williamsia sp. CHRR-6 TaxID=2835871 RepID=UPI001BD98C57|nr:DUF6882 domain-containing protein [Williamsia sp. CHRR-6]MBT0568666.1 hypothetical protein [Williamsia sp. CHRR-6]
MTGEPGGPQWWIDPGGDVINQLVDHTIILSCEAQDLFAERFVGVAWGADLGGDPTFWFDTEPPTHFRPYFVGSSVDGDSWMWGWHNVNDYPEAVIGLAQRLHDAGESMGSTELTTALLALDADVRRSQRLPDRDHPEMAYVYAAQAMSGVAAPVYYRGPVGEETFAWFVLDNPAEFHLPAPTVRASGAALTAALSTGFVLDHRLAVEAYADRRVGVTARLTTTGIDLDTSDGTVVVEFDELGRIDRLSYTAIG